MNWKNTEIEQPPENVPVFSWSKDYGMGYAMRANRLGKIEWHTVEGGVVWHNSESWTADIYFDNRHPPTMWHPLPKIPKTT